VTDTRRQRISRMRLGAARSAVTLVVVIGLEMVASESALAQTLTVLHNFTGSPDGLQPFAGLVRDAAGNLYGTTNNGGSSNYGTVFKVSESGKETVLYSFCSANGCTDGQLPLGGLIRDAKGNLYGTTAYGGVKGCTSNGCGVVFKVDPSGKETVLHNFSGYPTDGANPIRSLIQDANGDLYGTTPHGGAFDYGTVFKLSTTGNETILHNFAGYPSDGQYPYARLIRDAAGNLYGTTTEGGSVGYGTVYKLSTIGSMTVLHNFAGYPTDGEQPAAGLTRDENGNLYGDTGGGGPLEGGTVFKVSKTGKETLLYAFALVPARGLIRDANGNLYGTTFYGGSHNSGTVFKLSRTGQAKTLYSFCSQKNCTDGQLPLGGLIRDAKGNLYGTAVQGGSANAGTVWKLTP
jgi:uncharacterized repeat protein (TIGR03803 family)